MSQGGKTIIIAGQARLPKELSTGEVFQVIAEVDPKDGRILDVDFSPSNPLISRHLKSWIKGAVLSEDLSEVLQTIEQRFFHKGKKAVLTALKDLGREFREFSGRVPSEMKRERQIPKSGEESPHPEKANPSQG